MNKQTRILVVPKRDIEIEIDATDRTRDEYVIPELTVGIEQELITRPAPHENREGKNGQHAFELHLTPKVGLYQEFDGRTLPRTAAPIEELYAALPKDAASPEGIREMIELKTLRPSADVALVVKELRDVTKLAVEWLAANDRVTVPFSLHPLQSSHPISSYDFIRRIAREKHGAGPMRLACNASTQINVAVEDGNAALYVFKALSGISPILLALTSNSPFHSGRYSGLLAMRPGVRAGLLDGAWVCEDVAETTWSRYLDNRLKMCKIGEVMVAPWANNAPIRIRPDRKFCIEFSQPEFIPNFATLSELALFLQNLVRRTLVAYKNDEALPAFLGSRTVTGQLKNVQEAAIRGKKGSFIDADLNIAPMQEAIAAIFDWVGGGTYENLLKPTPAESAVAHFMELHKTCEDGYVDGCLACEGVIEYLLNEQHRQFVGQFASNDANGGNGANGKKRNLSPPFMHDFDGAASGITVLNGGATYVGAEK